MTRSDYFKAWDWKCDICIESGKLGESIFLSENALKSHGLLKHDGEKTPKLSVQSEVIKCHQKRESVAFKFWRKSLRRNYEKELIAKGLVDCDAESKTIKSPSKEVSLMIGKAWKRLTEEEKEPYLKLAALTGTEEHSLNEDPLGDLSGDTPKATLDLQEKQEIESEGLAKKARRDSNAFMLWRQDCDKEVIAKGLDEKEDKAKSIKTPLKEVSTMMKEDWNQLTEELKEPYLEEATKIAKGVLTKRSKKPRSVELERQAEDLATKAKLDSLAFKQWKQDYNEELVAKGLVSYDAKSKTIKTPLIEVSKMINKKWNGLTDKEKEPYLEMAARQPELV